MGMAADSEADSDGSHKRASTPKQGYTSAVRLLTDSPAAFIVGVS